MADGNRAADSDIVEAIIRMVDGLNMLVRVFGNKALTEDEPDDPDDWAVQAEKLENRFDLLGQCIWRLQEILPSVP